MPSLAPERSAPARGTDRLGRMGRKGQGQVLRFCALPRIGFGVVSAQAVASGPKPDSHDRFRRFDLYFELQTPGARPTAFGSRRSGAGYPFVGWVEPSETQRAPIERRVCALSSAIGTPRYRFSFLNPADQELHRSPQGIGLAAPGR